MVIPASPIYKIEMDISGTTTGWVLGISTLGTGTILQDFAATNFALGAVPYPVTISIRRGRQDELAKMEPGTATIVMDNGDGRYSPANATSPYYPNIIPRRRVRISAGTNFNEGGAAQGYLPLFYGYVNSIKPADADAQHSTVTFGASDWMGRMQRAAVDYTGPAEPDTIRIANVISAMGDDSGLYAFDGYSMQMQAATLADADGIGHINDVTDATRGRFFIDRQGQFAYHNRWHAYAKPGTFNDSYIFGRDVTTFAGKTIIPVLPGALDYDFDDKFLFNDISVNATATAEGVQTASDSTSQLRYGRASYRLESALLPAATAACLADSLLAVYKTPYPRVHELKVDIEAIPMLFRVQAWAALWALEIGDTVRVLKDQPNNQGIDATMVVEGISHDITVDGGGFSHIVGLRLADKRAYGVQPPWILSTSRLEAETYLVF